MRVALIIGSLFTFLMSGASSAHAFSISSGFTTGCHEMITSNAYKDFLVHLPVVARKLPEDDIWRDLVDYLLRDFPEEAKELDETRKFMLVSLLVGNRSPDTEGHSITNLNYLRQLHSDPSAEGQYAHSLRGPADDGQDGNAVAVAGTREMLRSLFHEADLAGKALPDDQIIDAPFYLDFYGQIQVPVFAPLYYIGRAAHCIQDSFAHMVRSQQDNLRKIVHVLNYAEAIGSEFDETRDGLAHSDSMDDCENVETVDTGGGPNTVGAAIEATTDLFIAYRELVEGRDPEAVDHLLDKWVVYKPGCTLDDKFCDNGLWLDVVRQKQTGPYLGCSSSPSKMPMLPWIGIMAILLFRRSRSRSPHRLL